MPRGDGKKRKNPCCAKSSSARELGGPVQARTATGQLELGAVMPDSAWASDGSIRDVLQHKLLVHDGYLSTEALSTALAICKSWARLAPKLDNALHHELSLGDKALDTVSDGIAKGKLSSAAKELQKAQEAYRKVQTASASRSE